ncbi:MAG: envelope stress response membrane protein PspB [Xanthomonadales bacterium]|nr:Phage shock protein B [Xanthomonadales bacterium]MCC6592668.1 envelope stress response membrane protein PspB [Xanthomonadales bacterium]MCE7930794.1 envelope stress response membrane protein PspB [Xanthomonadales bacterium PRO6]
MWAALEAPLVVFLVVVVPIWLVLHYRSKRQSAPEAGSPPPAQPVGELAELWQTARRMEERIRTLERILDADTPNWRGRT